MKGAYPAKILFFAFYYYFFFWGGGDWGWEGRFQTSININNSPYS